MSDRAANKQSAADIDEWTQALFLNPDAPNTRTPQANLHIAGVLTEGPHKAVGRTGAAHAARRAMGPTAANLGACADSFWCRHMHTSEGPRNHAQHRMCELGTTDATRDRYRSNGHIEKSLFVWATPLEQVCHSESGIPPHSGSSTKIQVPPHAE